MVQGAAVACVMLLLMSCLRPLSVLFLGLFSYWLYWTRCSFRIVLTPQLRAKFESWTASAEAWRRNSPGMFCLVSSGCLASLAILGHLISGSALVLALLVVSALISTKYNFKLLQFERKDFQLTEQFSYSNPEPELDDEFLPDVNDANLFVLERASDVATLSADCGEEEERSDDIPSELLIPDSIPEIDEHSTDEEDELAPAKQDNKQIKREQQPQSASQEQAASKANAMDFRKGHFKRDSSLSTTSSSSEESLSKGLQFPDHTSVDAGSAPALLQLGGSSETDASSSLMALAVKTQAQALLPSLVSGLVQWGGAVAAASNASGSGDSTAVTKYQQRRQVTALDSSDESDFEILETDDFK
ncbi:CG12576 [Drosophila busckii]|uniref:CG12576 n=2 Tax=Drosophila busckii TaxID=30019 RepID=A0A0M4ENL7_DROBS|nr:CG12576 [Drosophila busckii]